MNAFSSDWHIRNSFEKCANILFGSSVSERVSNRPVHVIVANEASLRHMVSKHFENKKCKIHKITYFALLQNYLLWNK